MVGKLTQSSREKLVKGFANLVAKNYSSLNKNNVDGGWYDYSSYTFTAFKRGENSIFHVHKKGTDDKIGVVTLNNKTKKITYEVMEYLDWNAEAQKKRPQPKSTYQATRNTSYRGGKMLAGVKGKSKYISEDEALVRLEKIAQAYKKGSLVLKEGGSKNWHGYHFGVEDLIWERNFFDGWVVHVYYPNEQDHIGTLRIGEGKIEIKIMGDVVKTIKL